MSFDGIKSALEINGKESQVFLPNEIFEDLQGYLTSNKELAYAYSYLYLTQFLYRNCKYFNTKTLIDNKVIKQVLGYGEDNRTMNHITKKGGLLDSIGYTISTKDIPLSWDFKKDDGEGLSFYMSSNLDKGTLDIPKMFFLKKPLKAFERTIQRVDKDGQIVGEEMQGTFYDVSNTHSVDYDVFMYCMSNKELGTTGFYLYSWLKHKNDIFKGGYDVPYEKLSAETGLTRTTMIKYLDALKSYRLIRFKFNQEYYVVGMTEGDRKATTYYTNDYYNFSDEPKPFQKMKSISNEEYLQSKKNEVKVTMEQLPF